MPCLTSALLKNLQYLDLSDNLLSDMTLKETLCDGNGTMKDLRVLNISGNALQVPSWNLEEFFLPVSEKSKKGLKVSVLEKNDLLPEDLSVSVPQSFSLLTHLVLKLSKLTHLDVSRNGYNSMPQSCSWPSTLRYLNLSWTSLTTITPCLPKTLKVQEWLIQQQSWQTWHHQAKNANR